MPEYLRAYVFIMILSLSSFYLLRKAFTAYLIPEEYKRLRKTWLWLTTFAFLSHNFWVFMGLVVITLSKLSRYITNPVKIFVMFMLVVPQYSMPIGGLGIINYLVEIDYLQLLTLILFLPYFFKLLRDRESLKFGRHSVDILVILFTLVSVYSKGRGSEITNYFRLAYYGFVFNILPYYIASRAIKTKDDFNNVLITLLFSLLVAGNLGIFEHVKGWLLYGTLGGALGLNYEMAGYLGRGEALRAISSFGQPIAYGFAMSIALGLFMYFTEVKEKKLNTPKLVMGMVLAGLYAPVSRGPWIGALVLFIIFTLLNKNAISKLIKSIVIGAMVFLALLATPQKDKIINLIPFIGTTESSTIDYRKDLLEAAKKVIARYPLLGNNKFLDEPEIKGLVLGEVSDNEKVKVDIVNSYIQVALLSGYIGLSLYVAIFLKAVFDAFFAMRRIRPYDETLRILGALLIASILSIMVTIFTVSSIMIIPVIYSLFIGFCVAYQNLVKKTISSQGPSSL